VARSNSTRRDHAVDSALGAPKLGEEVADALQLIRSKQDRIFFALSETGNASTYTRGLPQEVRAGEINNFDESITSLPKTLIASSGGMAPFRKMKKPQISVVVVLLLGSAAFAATELVPSAHAVQVTQNALELHLFAPTTASPGQTIGIELWTIFENVTSNRSDLAFNHTSVGVANTTLSFSVTTNVGIVPPHVHTPGGSFITLASFKQWVHAGAWNTSYTVPSQLGLYGVHVYANYTVISATRGVQPVHYITQAETTFSVADAPATVSGVSGLATASVDYAVLGLVAAAVVLDLVLLFWKRSPVKSS